MYATASRVAYPASTSFSTSFFVQQWPCGRRADVPKSARSPARRAMADSERAMRTHLEDGNGLREDAAGVGVLSLRLLRCL